MLPSQALQRDFVLPTIASGSAEMREQQKKLSSHGFFLGDIGLLLPRGIINEIVEKHSVCKLPNTPSWFSGMISMRGNMVPVFDLAELLTTRSLDDKKTLLVIGQGEAAVAVWIDELPIWKTFRDEERMDSMPPLPKTLKEHVISIYSQDGRVWVDWNVADYFSALSRNL